MKSLLLPLLSVTLLIGCAEPEPEKTSAEELADKFDAFTQSSKELLGAANNLLGDNLANLSSDLSNLELRLKELSTDEHMDTLTDLKSQLNGLQQRFEGLDLPQIDGLQQKLNELNLNSEEFTHLENSEVTREKLNETFEQLRGIVEELSEDMR